MTEIVESKGSCHTLFLQGGTNDAAQRNKVQDSIPDLEMLISAAKSKADRVVLIPPPPISKVMVEMESMMSAVASVHNVECIPIACMFPSHGSPGPYLYKRDGLHCTRRGTGLYGLAIIEYLKLNTKLVDNKIFTTSCIQCHRAGHGITNCQMYRSRRR